MGLFGSLFGSSASKYSQKEKQLSEIEIKQLVSGFKTKTLDVQEEQLVEKKIVERRRGDGKISLRQIYEALTVLKNSNRISKYDRDGLMSVFKSHFSK